MRLLDCPEWLRDDDAKLPGIAEAASAFVRFLNRQNPKGYLLSHGDLKDWHKKLFQKAVPVTYYAGNYRGVAPDKPCLNTPVFVAGVPGSDPSNVENEMKAFSDELVRATQATDDYLAVSRSSIERIKVAAQIAAFAGGKIIQIHPFINGNGRMARMAMNFFLHRYLGKIPFFIDRPTHPDYSVASSIAMREGNFVPLYQYLVEILALERQ